MSMKTLLPLLALAALACKDDDDSPVDDSSSPAADADGDGSPAAEDCDDGDATVYPGAAEVCDGLDQDCDGVADNGVGVEYWVDADGDGIGGSTSTGLVCAFEAGMSEQRGDCDDSDSSIAPGLPDPCDGVDSDCDGLIDEDDASVWYRDADGDRYGDPARITESCEQPSGYVANADDCDDDNGAISPRAEEVCSDGVDNNCDSLGCRYEGTSKLEVVGTAVGSPDGGSDYFGAAIAVTGPWAGYSAAVAVGAPYSSGGSSYSGAVSVLTPSPTGSISRDLVAYVYGKETYAALGQALAAAGDADGDGSAELLVGAPNANQDASSGGGTGAVYLVSGDTSGTWYVEDVALVSFFGRNEGSSFGQSVAAFDMDGDGVQELAVGAPGDQNSSAVASGAVYVFPSTLRGDQKWSSNKAVVYGEAEYDYFGFELANAGDTDGDGREDLLVGIPYRSADIGSAAGAVSLFLGPLAVSGSGSGADLQVSSDAAETYVGYALASRVDLNGDGYHDVAFCAPGASTAASQGGAAFVFYGPTTGELSTADADASLGLSEKGAYGCQTLAGGDSDGDGVGDLALGSPSSDLGASSGGAAVLVYGPYSGSIDAIGVGGALVSARTSTQAAIGLDMGDLEGDGPAEVLVGAPYSTSTTGGLIYYVPGLGL